MSPPSAAEGQLVLDFPVLLVALEWVQHHCVIPDGFAAGQPYVFADWQLEYMAHHYRVRPDARLTDVPGVGLRPTGAAAFHYRRSQLVMPQKAGKGPLTASQVCLEGVGPAMFAGWASGGEAYSCREHGCGCGWVWEYEAGEPMGEPWPTPLIQITAYSEEQTGNVYDALRPMVEKGPLDEVIPAVGTQFARLPGGGRIDTVTSSQQSRLGQRVTFVVQDETGIWTAQNKMLAVADTQRRGAAGMGGRTVETTNAWDPSEHSVAQRTAEAALRAQDVYRMHRLPPAHLSYGDKRERHRIHRHVYAGSWWVGLDAIEAEAVELMQTDPAQAERFFGNRIVAGSGSWFDKDEQWSDQARPELLVPEGAEVAGGFDGSESDDWTAIRLETQEGHRFTPRYGPDRRPTYWNPAEWGGSIPRAEVDAAVDEIMRRYKVRRFYCDPRDWQSEIGDWALRHGSDTCVIAEWATYRVVPMHSALVRSKTDIVTGRSTHDGCPVTTLHVANARKAARPSDRYILAKPTQHQKIDLAMADTLAHEAASDQREAGWKPKGRLSRVSGRAATY